MRVLAVSLGKMGMVGNQGVYSSRFDLKKKPSIGGRNKKAAKNSRLFWVY
jgi:hypothetical protein